MVVARVSISDRRRLHRAGLDQPLHDRRRRAHLVVEDPAELDFEKAMPRQEFIEIAIDEPEFGDRLEQKMQEQPDVLGVGRPAFGRGQGRLDFLLELREQGLDDLVLGMEVIIEVARTDVHRLGDRRRRRLRERHIR